MTGRRPILIAGYGGIGDHVRCFALARHVAAQFPGRPIDFLCRSPAHRLVRFVPELRAAYVDDTPHGQLRLRDKLRLAAELRAQNYQRVYVVSRTLKAAIIPYLAGIPERVGWRGEGRFILINAVRGGEGSAKGETGKVCALALADWPAGAAPVLPARMVVDPQERLRWLEAELGGAPRGPVLALAPGAYNDKRQWPIRSFARVAAHFAERGWQVWVLGGPKEREMAAEIGAAAPVRDFTGTPLEAGVFQLASATLFLGNDSGMLHIAGALGTPCVGLFGPTCLEVTGPQNANVIGVRPRRGIDLADLDAQTVIDVMACISTRAA